FFRPRDKSRADEGRRFPVDPWHDLLRGVALFIALFVLIHVVENWRGHREWARAKAELAAKGESLDYASFLKPPVPDEENVMAHPYMKEYFIRGGKLFETPTYSTYTWGIPSKIAELRKLPRWEQNPSVIDLAGEQGSRKILSLSFSNTPMVEVFSRLAREAGLNLSLDPNIHEKPWGWFRAQRRSEQNYKKGTLEWQPKSITEAFTNTAIEALSNLATDNF